MGMLGGMLCALVHRSMFVEEMCDDVQTQQKAVEEGSG